MYIPLQSLKGKSKQASFLTPKKLKDKKGFSLGEALFTIAIIMVALALIIPNVMRQKIRLTIMGADDIAKELFLEAQNELVFEKSQGELKNIYQRITTASAEDGCGLVADRTKTLYYVRSDSSVVRDILGGEKLDAISAGGCFYVVVEPSGATVEEVFYSPDSSMTWDEFNDEDANLRELEGRIAYYRTNVVGYYGAEVGELLHVDDPILLKNVHIVNSEELYVEFEVYVDANAKGTTTATLSILGQNDVQLKTEKINLTPTNADNIFVSNPKTVTIDGGDGSEQKAWKCYTVRRLLDSMEEGHTLGEIIPTINMSMGCDLTAKVDVRYVASRDEGGAIEEVSDQAVQNSLFESLVVNSAGKNTAGIRYIRHLSNINRYSEKTVYIQKNTLDYNADYYAWSGGKYFDNSDTTADGAVRPFAVFAGVALKSGSDYLGRGNLGYQILNFKSKTGIFTQALSNSSFQYVYVVNPVVETKREERVVDGKIEIFSAGGLVGIAERCTITNCRVYQDRSIAYEEDLKDDPQYVSSIKINIAERTNSGDPEENTATIDYVGGLAGYLRDCVVQESLSAVPIVRTADGYAGGLVGYAVSSIFSKCYGNTNQLTGTDAGGFAGGLENSQATYTYAVAETFSEKKQTQVENTDGNTDQGANSAISAGDASKVSAGYSAVAYGGSVSRSYALIGSVQTEEKEGTLIAFLPDSSNTTVEECYDNYSNSQFMAEQTAKGDWKSYNDIIKSLESDEWEYDYSANGEITSLDYSKPYDTEKYTAKYVQKEGDVLDYSYMKDTAYLNLRIKGMPHYGDWPDASLWIEYRINLESIGAGTELVCQDSSGNDFSEEIKTYNYKKLMTNGAMADGALREYVIDRENPHYPSKDSIQYVFKCWKLVGAEDVYYYPGDPIETLNQNVILEAQWEPGIRLVYLTNANGHGSFFGKEDYTVAQLFYDGEEVEVLFTDDTGAMPSNSSGFFFVSWKEEKAKGKSYTYIADERDTEEQKYKKTHIVITDPKDGTYQVNLLAQWENSPRKSNLRIRVNDSFTSSKKLELTLNGGVKVEYGGKAGDYYVTAKAGVYDLLLRGIETGVKVVVDGAGAHFFKEGKELQVLDLYTLTISYRLNGKHETWTSFDSDIKPFYRLDTLYINDEMFDASYMEECQISDGLYESPVMMPGSTFSIFAQEAQDVNLAVKEIKAGETPELKSVYVRQAGGNLVNAKTTAYVNYCSVEYQSDREVTNLPDMVIVQNETNYTTPEESLHLKAEKGIFTGWKSQAEEGSYSKISIKAGESIYIGNNEGLVLHARWKESVSVTYHTNFYKKTHEDAQCNIDDIIGKIEDDAFYSATKDADGKNYNYAAVQTIYYDEEHRTHQVLSTKLERTGYYFIGWGTEPYAYDGGTTYWPGSELMLDENITLYAQWAYDNNYTIVYLMDENHAYGDMSYTTFSIKDENVTLSMNQYTRAGKEFVNWHAYLGGTANQNDINNREYFEQGQSCRVDAISKCSEPNKCLCVMYGTWEDISSSDSYLVDLKLDKMKARYQNKYAYEGQPYKVTFDCEGGFKAPKQLSVFVNGVELKEGEGYSWNQATLKLEIFSKSITGPITIVASATPEKHSFSYVDVIDGKEQILLTDEVGFNTYNAVKSIQTVLKVSKEEGVDENYIAEKHPGYVFLGWNTSADGKGKMYQTEDAVFIEGDMALYACWKESDVVGAGIYNGYLCYYDLYTDKKSSGKKYYLLALGNVQTVEDGETLKEINNGGQVHFNVKKENETIVGYIYYYCVMLKKGSQTSQYEISYLEEGNSSYQVVSQDDLKLFNPSELREGNNPDLEYKEEDFNYYYFSRTYSKLPELTHIKITRKATGALEEKASIFRLENQYRPTNATSNVIKDTEKDVFGNNKKFPKVSVFNGSVPTINRTYANFFKNRECQATFDTKMYGNDSRYEFNSINLLDENGVSISTRNNLAKKNGDTWVFQKEAMAELKPGTYKVIFDYSEYDNDPSFELHIYEESLMGYRYLEMDIEQAMAVSLRMESSGNEDQTFVQLGEIAFYGDEKGTDRYKFEDASLIYLKTTKWSSGNQYEDISLMTDNNSRTKLCGKIKYEDYQQDNVLRVVIDVGDGYQFSPNIYGYTGYITAGDADFYMCRNPRIFSFYGTNANGTDGTFDQNILKEKTFTYESVTQGNETVKTKRYSHFWTLIDEQDLMPDPNKFGKQIPTDKEVNGIPIYHDTYRENDGKLNNWLRDFCPNDVTDTPTRPDGNPLEYDMQPTPLHRYHSYDLSYDTNTESAKEDDVVSWYDPQNSEDSTSGNKNITDTYGDQVVGFCIPIWKDASGKTVKYFLGWSTKKNATEAEYTSGSHLNLIAKTTLYAVWSEIRPVFSISFEANDDQTALATNVPANTKGSGEITLPSTIPEREGYKFLGWIWLGDADNSKDVDFSEKGPDNLGMYQPGDVITLHQNMTLYARWVEAKCVTVLAPGCSMVSSDWTLSSSGYKYYGKEKTKCSFELAVNEDSVFDEVMVSDRQGNPLDSSQYVWEQDSGADNRYHCTIYRLSKDIVVEVKTKMKGFTCNIFASDQITDIDHITLQDSGETVALEDGKMSVKVTHGETCAFYFESETACVVTGSLSMITTIASQNGKKYRYLCRIWDVKQDMALTITSGLSIRLKENAEATDFIQIQCANTEDAILPLPEMVGFYPEAGMEFVGWKQMEEEALNTESQEEEEIIYPGVFDGSGLAENMVLIPRWRSKTSVSIQLDYNYDGKKGEMTSYAGETVTLGNPTRAGYIFKGWLKCDNIGTPVNPEQILDLDGLVVTEDMTVKAKWAKECTVYFDGNGGTPFVDFIKVAEGDKLGKLPAVRYKNSDAVTAYWVDEQENRVTKETIVEKDMTLTAVGGDPVRFHLNPDEPSSYVNSEISMVIDYKAPDYQEVDDGSKNEGYLFVGWSASGNTSGASAGVDYAEGDTVPANTRDLYAVWIKMVTYHVNIDEETTVVIDQKTQSNQDYIAKSMTDLTSNQKEHSVFIGWTDLEGGSETRYEAGDTVPAGTSDLYAVWRSAIQYHYNPYDLNKCRWGSTEKESAFTAESYEKISDGYKVENASFVAWVERLSAPESDYIAEGSSLEETITDLYAVFDYKVPNGYTKLEWVGVNGSPDTSGSEKGAYVDTGYKPNSKTRIVMKANNFKEQTTLNALYGVQNSSSLTHKMILVASSSAQARADYGIYPGVNTGPRFEIGLPMEKDFYVDQDRNLICISWDNAIKVNKEISETVDSNLNVNKNLYLFNINGWIRGKAQFHGKVYYCRIYEDNKLIVNLIPVKNGSKLGFYDTISKTFKEGKLKNTQDAFVYQ